MDCDINTLLFEGLDYDEPQHHELTETNSSLNVNKAFYCEN